MVETKDKTDVAVMDFILVRVCQVTVIVSDSGLSCCVPCYTCYASRAVLTLSVVTFLR